MILRTEADDHEKDIAELIEKNDYILVDYRFVKQKKSRLMKVAVNKAGGISHKDCQTVTKLIQSFVEEKEELADCGIEVSSPGICRVLKSLRELKAFEGHRVSVSYLDKDAKLLQEIGSLISGNQTEILVKTDKQFDMCLPVESVKKIRLVD